jgi:hypothetical protein
MPPRGDDHAEGRRQEGNGQGKAKERTKKSEGTSPSGFERNDLQIGGHPASHHEDGHEEGHGESEGKEGGEQEQEELDNQVERDSFVDGELGQLKDLVDEQEEQEQRTRERERREELPEDAAVEGTNHGWASRFVVP